MNLFLAASEDPTSHAVPHRLFGPFFELKVADSGTNIPFFGVENGIYEFYITNHLMMTFVTAIVLMVVAGVSSRRISIYDGQGIERYQTRGRLSQLFETICAYIRDEVAAPNLRELTDKYVPFIWTVFFFVLFANVLGLIPIGYMLTLLTGDTHFEHWGGTATGNLSLNGVLASISLFMIIFVGIRETSVKDFFNHFNPVGWADVKLLPIALLLYVLEWLSLFIKCLVLAMRLFGTMMAGHLVLAAFVGLIFSVRSLGDAAGYGVGIAVVLVGTALSLLELFICFLQAFIFTFLTVLFIASLAVHEHDHGSEHDGDALDDANQTDPDKILDPARLRPAV